MIQIEISTIILNLCLSIFHSTDQVQHTISMNKKASNKNLLKSQKVKQKLQSGFW